MRRKRGRKDEPPRLCTTHVGEGEKAEYIATPMLINGRRSWAYKKEGRVTSYIPVEEANDLFCKQNIESAEVDF